MSKGDVFENDFLQLIFNAIAINELAQDDSTSPAVNLSVALHTADPGEAGTQLTNEATYTGYTRINVARTAGGWLVTGNSVSPVANIPFPQATAGSETLTHFSVGTGVGDKLLYSGTLTPNVVVTNGVQPEVTTASTITED